MNSNTPNSTKEKKKHHSKASPNKLENAINSFNRILQTRHNNKINLLTDLLRNIVKMGHYQAVLSLIKKMKSQGIQPDYYTFSVEMNCYCHLKEVNLGFGLLATLFKIGYKPNVVTFTTLIKGLFLENKSNEAVRLFQKLVREDLVEINYVTYGTVINGLCKTGNTRSAIGLIRSLEKLDFMADTMVYSMIIDSLCKDRMVNDALKILVEMREKGVSPNAVTYNSMIKGLCNFGRWNEVKRLLNEMGERKLCPDVYTFNILVDAFCKEGMVREAEDVLKTMIQRGGVPDVVTYNALIDGYCL